MDIAQGLPFNPKCLWTPHSCSDENALIPIAEQVLNLQGAANGGVGPYLNANGQKHFLITVQDGLGKPEFRYAVLEHAANLVPGIKYGHAVAALGQQDRNGDACGTGADNSHLLSVLLRAVYLNPLQASIRYIVLNAAHMNRLPFPSQDAVPFALALMVAHKGTHKGHGIIGKQHGPRILKAAFLKGPDHGRDWRMDGASLLAHWFFTLKASVCFVNYMDCHGMFPPYFETRSSVFSSFRFLQTNHSTAL